IVCSFVGPSSIWINCWLAGQIRYLERTQILLSVLQDFVSLFCLNSFKTWRKEEDNAQSTSKDTKRDPPVRLYK
ncbi:unnamed protein product, partial [Coregonus sp. 'balchen']